MATGDSRRSASSSSASPVLERSDEMASRKLLRSPKTQNQNKKRDDRTNSDDRVADLPEWLEKFEENLVDTELPASAHSSRESDLEHPTEVATKSRKHSIHTHFPKDRNCDVCLRTKMTRGLCRGRTGEALPRAEKFGDLIKADHKVLSEESESRNNHRYAVVVQDLASQWIQSYPCKNEEFSGDGKSLRKFLEPSQKTKVIYTDNSMEFGKSCEDIS